jgi:hypothetical protein
MDGGLTYNPVFGEVTPLRRTVTPPALTAPVWAMPVANQGNVPDFIPQGAMIYAVPEQQAGWFASPPFVRQSMPVAPQDGLMPQFGLAAFQFGGQRDPSPSGARKLGPARQKSGHLVPRIPSEQQIPGVRASVIPAFHVEYPTLLKGVADLKQEENHRKPSHPRLASEENLLELPDGQAKYVVQRQSSRPTPEQMLEMEMDAMLAQSGYMVCRHKVYNPGLPAGVLGKGNFGCVYKAVKNSVPWAVKKIDNASTYEYLTKKEIEVLRLLTDHPAIVGLGDTISHPARDWMFIIMEFVDGGDLLGALTKLPYMFEESLVRAMMFHLACGLGVAHEAGVLHRDLKPENILLTKDLMPKIADFGLARFVGSADVVRTVAGTPGYIAPEVLDVRVPYDFPADVFSMGLVFADLMNPESCCQWWIADKPEPVKRRYQKKWPADKSPMKMSTQILEIQQGAIANVPGERITAYQLCKDILQLSENDPMPCALWSMST